MKFDEWLTTIPIQHTEKGARLDLRLYVYPDGHGDFCVEDKDGRSDGNPQPVNNAEEAREVLEKIWSRAMKLKAESATPAVAPTRTIAERLADVIGIAPDLPEDMAAQHDHYIHGAPKS
jgi:hypothetical protein